MVKVTCLVSGGKDSVLALWLALHQFDVISILTVMSKCTESYLFHIPNSQYVDIIADMLEISHRKILIDSCNVEDEIHALYDSPILIRQHPKNLSPLAQVVPGDDFDNVSFSNDHFTQPPQPTR